MKKKTHILFRTRLVLCAAILLLFFILSLRRNCGPPPPARARKVYKGIRR